MASWAVVAVLCLALPCLALFAYFGHDADLLRQVERIERTLRRTQTLVSVSRRANWRFRITVARRLNALERANRPPPREPLDANERVRMQHDWPTLACPNCGTAHWGTCPRVAKVISERTGQKITVTTEFWPNDQWAPPPGALTVRDVWGDSVPAKPQGESDAAAKGTS